MSSQPPHPLLLTPGPIEFDDAVLQSMGQFSESHTGPGAVASLGESLTMLRKLLQTSDPASQPFVISGSGTLGWDLVAANVAEPGDRVLVVSTGYFSDGFADCLGIYGANVTRLAPPAVGAQPSLADVEEALSRDRYTMVTVTHVDTSTAVLADVKGIAALLHRVAPDALLVVDGVCSVACEELEFDATGIDVVVTASQKAIGCPAGLSISMFSGRAMQKLARRKTPPASYFASMKKWLPIMQSYEAGKPAYFATPSPQLLRALHTSLSQILAAGPIADRVAKHREASDRIKEAVNKLGLKQVASRPEDQAHGMTAIYLPENVKATDLLPVLAKNGIILAAGLHKDIAPKYIRMGHMGITATKSDRGDIDRAIKALDEGLAEVGYVKP